MHSLFYRRDQNIISYITDFYREEILEILNVKTGGDGISDGTNNTSTTIKIKTGIKNLKNDINLITIQTGVLSSILLSRDLLRMKENFTLQKKKQISRRKFDKHSEMKKNENDEEDDYDD